MEVCKYPWSKSNTLKSGGERERERRERGERRKRDYPIHRKGLNDPADGMLRAYKESGTHE